MTEIVIKNKFISNSDQEENTTKACLQHHDDGPPITNKLAQKWQKSNVLNPGQRVIHPCLRADFQEGHADGLIFGRPIKRNLENEKNKMEDPHVEDILGGATSSSSSFLSCTTRSNMIGKFVGGEECKAIKHEINEKKVYKSAQRELGRSFNRGHVIPEFMKRNDYRHGLKTTKSNFDAKSLLYPEDCNKPTNNEEGIPETCGVEGASHSNYAKSHGSYLPGQQRKRNYNWPIDPVTTVFGIKGQDAIGRCSSKGVSDALHHDISNSNTKINLNMLEEQRVSLQNNNNTFGKTTCSKNESAADCLRSTNYDQDEKMIGLDDLGKSVRPGFRNVFTEKRRFGCPSIRTDIPKYERHSVADTQNYGDDVNAEYLLRPTQCSSFGIDDDEFHKPRSEEYILSLFEDCGYNLSEQEFDSIWTKYCDENGSMTIDQFQEVYNDYLVQQEKKKEHS